MTPETILENLKLRPKGSKHTRIICVVMLCLLFSASSAWAEFTISVETVDEESTLDFGSLDSMKADGSPAGTNVTKRVRLIVGTDLDRPYKISQILTQTPRNESMTECPLQSFLYYAVLRKGNGVIRATNRVPMSIGEQELFLSDSKGENAEILVQYDFKVPNMQEAGRYETSITYRIITN